MIVSAASRMSSAISFGVFWRFAPSTIAIMRSRKVSPGLARDAHDEPVGEHARAAGDRAAVAAALADDRRALAGDRALVDRRDALDDLAVAGDRPRRPRRARRRPCAAASTATRLSARVALRRRRASCAMTSLARLAQRVGLRLAAAFGHRLGEVREQHREPQPERDREDEAGRRLALADRAPGRRAAS